MSFIKKTLLIVPAIAILFSSNTFSSSVGDIRVSVLPLKEFQKINGTEWVLMDGQTNLDVGNALRAMTGMTKVPDGRGKFFRMKDHGAGIDANGETVIGTIEGSLTKLPWNGFSTDTRGGHTHPIDSSGAHSHGISDPGHGHPVSETSGGGRTDRFATGAGNGNPGTNISVEQGRAWPVMTGISVNSSSSDHSHSMQVRGEHNHAIQGGDLETRPVNIVVNYFIKISEPQHIDNCTNIKSTATKETVTKRYICLKRKLNGWESGELKITSGEVETIVREIVFLKNSSLNKLTEFQLDYIEHLRLKYPSYVNL
ncbi:MAG: hypothetical protein HQK49_13250 [Oligoflexia bacterium]|nr:hypothetical protein [Oligoflexia bacterium]